MLNNEKHMWGSSPTVKQLVKDSARAVRSQERELDRSIRELEREEKKYTVMVQRMSAQGQTVGARSLARQIVQCRKARNRLFERKAIISGVHLQAKHASLMHGSMQSVSGSVRALQIGNAQASLVPQTARQLSREMMRAEMLSEELDVLDDDDSLDDDTDDVLDSVLGGIVSVIMSKAPSAPTSGIQSQSVEHVSESAR